MYKKEKNRILKILNADEQEEDKGLELHSKSIVCDSLSFDPMPFSDEMVQKMNEMLDAGKSYWEVNAEFRKTHPSEIVGDPKAREEYVEVWRKSGVTCISNSLQWYGGMLGAIESVSRANYKIDKHRDVVTKATCAEDIKRAKVEGKHAILLSFQSTTHLGGGDWREEAERALDNLDLFYGLGVRIMQLTYNIRNLVGDGCFERNQSGLSDFGVRVVERMNEIGMLVDISHCGPQTTLEAVEVTKSPIAATHTACRGLHDRSRAKTDEELQAIAEKDGYVGICGLISIEGNLKGLIDHVDYAVNLIGVDHVGIGTDVSYFSPKAKRLREKDDEEGYTNRADGYIRAPTDRESHRRTRYERYFGSLATIYWPYLTVGLVSRGYSDQEIQKIIGGNFLKILEKVI